MPTRTIRSRRGDIRRSAASLLGALALLAMAPAPPAHAQEAAPDAGLAEPRTPLAGYVTGGEARARLGLYLQSGCAGGLAADAGCDAPPIVARLVDGAPAAVAGVQTGDTLLALDGVSLGSAAGRRSLEALRDGEPVTLRIGRDSGRRELSVTPTARPLTGLFALSGPSWRSAAPSNVQVFRLRDSAGVVSEFHFAPTPDRPERPGNAEGFVVFESDESGVLSMGFGRPDVQVITRDGRRVGLHELERRIREAGEQAAQEFGVVRVFQRTPEGPGFEVEVEVEAAPSVGGAPPRRLILEDAPLARRLESVHQRSLVTARARIDSILHARGEARVIPAPDAPASSTFRVAGAEFRSLTSELADYFAVDTGVLVLRVIRETPADRLGLRGGDVVIEVGGRETPDVTTFRRLMEERLVAGDEPEVKWNRKGQELRGNLALR
ncbi:MAG: PDZ domain-containing protein [Gemmatimonadota bacterium]